MCMTPKFPFLLSVLPFSLLGTGFFTLPSLLGRRTPSSSGLDAKSTSSRVPNPTADAELACFWPGVDGPARAGVDAGSCMARANAGLVEGGIVSGRRDLFDVDDGGCVVAFDAGALLTDWARRNW